MLLEHVHVKVRQAQYIETDYLTDINSCLERNLPQHNYHQSHFVEINVPTLKEPEIKVNFSLFVSPKLKKEDLTTCAVQRAIMEFNGNLLNRCGKTYLRAFPSWIAGMALNTASLMPKMSSAKQPGLQYLTLKWICKK